MRKILFGFLALAILPAIAWAQQGANPSPSGVGGININRSTLNSSVAIATSGTFQQILAATTTSNTIRQSLTIENNSTSPTMQCWIFLGPTSATVAGGVSAVISNSILLLQGGSYTRYWPIVPSDAVQATCQTGGTLYVDTQ
jgi:hypothetical protein